jgi:two-component system LytT family response regulator
MSQTLRVVVVDDERPARLFLQAALRAFDDVEVVAEAEDGATAVQVIRCERPHVAFLDLEMPEMDGLAVARMLDGEHRPYIVFVTAHERHAVRAFEVEAVDYLLKPVESVRLRATLDRVRTRLEVEEAFAGAGVGADYLERIPVRRRHEIVLVPVAVVANGELLQLTTHTNERFTLAYRLKDLVARLDPARFIRLGRSAVVNIAAIRALDPMPGGTYVVTMQNEQRLSTSRMQSRVVRERLLRI